MTHEFIAFETFTCLGLEEEGPLDQCSQWVPALWGRFRSRMKELRKIPCQGVWGLMSDSEIFLAPWGGERGRYLASWQVPNDTLAFADFRLWTIPARTWLAVDCKISTLDAALEHARSTLRHHLEWQWEGAVHEFYPANFCDPATDSFQLMVPLVPR